MKTAKFEISATLRTVETVRDFNFSDPKGQFQIFWLGSNVMCFEYDEEDTEDAQDFINDISETLNEIIGSDEYSFYETETECDY